MNVNIKNIWKNNLKIHYFWTFLMSFVFLSPVISLFYQFYWLSVSNIVFISSIYYFFIFLLEIPTSTLWDNLWRVKTMIYSILSWFIPILIYLFIPSYEMFFVAIFFSALWQALWNWNAQAKLEDDLKAIWKKADFWKTIWKLISLVQVWKLLTPVVIYFILKYFDNWYTILASLDLFVWIIVFLTIIWFKEIDDSYIVKTKWILNSIKLHLSTISESYRYLISSKSLVFLLVSMLFGTDLYLLSKVILPIIVDSWVEDYIWSIVVWFATLVWILWSLSASKIAWKIWWIQSFSLFIFLNMLLHFFAFFFFENKLILTIIFLFITFVELAYIPVRNHILMDLTPVKAKATIRSLFISMLLLYQFIVLFIFSFMKVDLVLLIIGFLMICAILVSRYIKFDFEK